jgi:hypothetical protein
MEILILEKLINLVKEIYSLNDDDDDEILYPVDEIIYNEDEF